MLLTSLFQNQILNDLFFDTVTCTIITPKFEMFGAASGVGKVKFQNKTENKVQFMFLLV